MSMPCVLWCRRRLQAFVCIVSIAAFIAPEILWLIIAWLCTIFVFTPSIPQVAFGIIRIGAPFVLVILITGHFISFPSCQPVSTAIRLKDALIGGIVVG